MAGDTEKIILETARKHFVQYGYAATRMQDIATEAGINKAMLHYYFRSKEKLYREIVTRTLDYVIPKFAGVMSAQGTIWERFENMVETYFGILLKNPDIPVFLLSELTQNQGAVVEEMKRRSGFFPSVMGFMQFLKGEMDNGTIRQFPPLHLLLNVLGMTVFPFVAKPVFCTIFDFSDEKFASLMEERKALILDFLKKSLEPD